MDTNVTILRNIITPLLNYFDYKKKCKMDEIRLLLESQEEQIISVLPQIKELVSLLPNEAAEPLYITMHKVMRKKYGEQLKLIGVFNDSIHFEKNNKIYKITFEQVGVNELINNFN
jgi:hypothetical protein